MAKRVFKVSGFTPVAVADTAAFTNNGYMALQGGSSTQLTRILDVKVDGLAAAAAATPLILARDSTVGATLTSLSTGESDEALHPATAALAAPVQPFTASSTKPQRSATKGLLPCGLNAFGGTFRWVAAPDEEIFMLGNTASNGEISLSCYTGGSPGLVMAGIVYETL